MLVSHHVSATELCKRLRNAQQRENKLIVENSLLIVENKRLKDQIEQASEQYRLSSVCRELKAENERLKRLATWPHDADPFTSPDHDNDSRNYQ